jgi:hypothetical protein
MPETSDLASLIESTTPAGTHIPVEISYEIIRLFSEGLYQSPQKAIEELVSNSYDAEASAAHVLLPRPGDDGDNEHLPTLWVIDDGTGMDEAGFFQLWRVADSSKADVEPEETGRAPIGQFGIGKLASYVLAWRLSHISCVDGVIKSTSMNFRDLAGLHQYETHEPFELTLYTLSADEARLALADVETRDPAAWNLMFGPDASSTWTAAGLSDFKDLYEKLSAGRLAWVLSTGLPLHSKFEIWLDGKQLKSSKVKLKAITSYSVGGDDKVAADLELASDADGIEILGIAGKITGKATIYEKRLTEGKSDQYSRSHGFFVRVRERIINLEDELFGLDALNHAAWSRFSMEITADGLREHLLSSREGVRESAAIDTLRKYMHGVFNQCRKAYDDWSEKELAGIDIEQLLRDAPSLFVTEPIVAGVRDVVETQRESYYVAQPDIPDGEERETWLQDFASEVAKTPIARVQFEPTGRYDRALHFVPDTRTLVMNTEHPFIDKLLSGSRDRGSATLFGSAELLLDLLLQEQGLSPGRRIDVLDDRDRLLRLLAGDLPSTAAEVLRLLDVANRDETALERAVGAAFQVLGFEYERRGGNVEGCDGVLYARLGRGSDTLADYKLVYDAKQTSSPAVPADKIDLSSLEDFRVREEAQFGFFLANEYAAQLKPDGKLNRVVANATSGKNPQPVTLLRIGDLRKLVELHYRFGITLTRLRSLFEDAHTVPEVSAWISALELELSQEEPQVPLQRLLEGLELAKSDRIARPNVYTVRARDPELEPFSPERLVAALDAVETIIGSRWLEVESSGDVVLHHTAPQIVAEVERHLRDLFGINALPAETEDEAEDAG